MYFSNDNSTIISARSEEDNVVLRIDLSGWYELDKYENIVHEITLLEPKDSVAAVAAINRNVDEFVWGYEFLVETGVFSISLDNSDVVDIKCVGISERTTDMTTAELLHRYQLLSEKYNQESTDNWKGWRNYANLRNSLTAELNKELGNWEEKLQFYTKQELKDVEKAQAAIRLCKNFINLIENFHKEANA